MFSAVKPTVSSPKLAAQRGFTLLEVLISFTLIAIIMATMYSGIRIVYRVSDKGEKQINTTNQVRSVQTFLRRQLSGVLPIKLDPRLGQFSSLFLGEPQKMEFVTTLPGHLRGGGVYKQTIEFVEDNDQSALMFRFEPVNVPNDAAINLPEPVILIHAKDIRFYYWDGLGEEDKDIQNWDWQEEWADRDRIPALIRIEAEFTENVTTSNRNRKRSNAFWPSLVIAPIRHKYTP